MRGGRTHRTQIVLESWQYQRLQAEAAARGVSIGGLVREAVSTWFHSRDERPSALDDIVAVGRGNGDPVAREHDRFLYDSSSARRKRKAAAAGTSAPRRRSPARSGS